MNNKIWSADRILWLNSNIGCFEIICSPRYITPFLPLNSNIGCFEILIEREVTHYDAVKQ